MKISAQQAVDYMTGQLGYPLHVAQALAANYQSESGFDAGINERNPVVPGSRGGYGLYQLTGPRRRQYEAWAAKNGRALNDPYAQMDFQDLEFNTTEQRARDSIWNTDNVYDATKAVSNDFLRPGIPHLEGRLRNAEAIAQTVTGHSGALRDYAKGREEESNSIAEFLTGIPQTPAPTPQMVQAAGPAPSPVVGNLSTKSGPTIGQDMPNLLRSDSVASMRPPTLMDVAAPDMPDLLRSDSAASQQPQTRGLISDLLGTAQEAIEPAVDTAAGAVQPAVDAATEKVQAAAGAVPALPSVTELKQNALDAVGYIPDVPQLEPKVDPGYRPPYIPYDRVLTEPAAPVDPFLGIHEAAGGNVVQTLPPDFTVPPHEGRSKVMPPRPYGVGPAPQSSSPTPPEGPPDTSGGDLDLSFAPRDGELPPEAQREVEDLLFGPMEESEKQALGVSEAFIPDLFNSPAFQDLDSDAAQAYGDSLISEASSAGNESAASLMDEEGDAKATKEKKQKRRQEIGRLIYAMSVGYGQWASGQAPNIAPAAAQYDKALGLLPPEEMTPYQQAQINLAESRFGLEQEKFDMERQKYQEATGLQERDASLLTAASQEMGGGGDYSATMNALAQSGASPDTIKAFKDIWGADQTAWEQNVNAIRREGETFEEAAQRHAEITREKIGPSLEEIREKEIALSDIKESGDYRQTLVDNKAAAAANQVINQRLSGLNSQLLLKGEETSDVKGAVARMARVASSLGFSTPEDALKDAGWSTDAIAAMDAPTKEFQLNMARQKTKGQGSLSDPERKSIAEATVNADMSTLDREAVLAQMDAFDKIDIAAADWYRTKINDDKTNYAELRDTIDFELRPAVTQIAESNRHNRMFTLRKQMERENPGAVEATFGDQYAGGYQEEWVPPIQSLTAAEALRDAIPTAVGIGPDGQQLSIKLFRHNGELYTFDESGKPKPLKAEDVPE